MRFSADADLVAGNALEFVKILISSWTDGSIGGLVVADQCGLEDAIVVIAASRRRIRGDGEIIDKPTLMLVGGFVQGDKVEAEPDGPAPILRQ